MNSFHRKCPLCSGDLVRSRTHSQGYTGYFWKKPWKTGLFAWGVEKVYPWACMGCGVVLLYLDRLPAVAEEFKTARDGERVRGVSPEPIKS
jgi:hypothetical protein